MPDEAAFIQTIREHPDDDGPRLVYADWLEERGECERAEFIRVQIELARGLADPERHNRLRIREQFLLENPISQWVARNARWTQSQRFRRGVLEAITAEMEKFLSHAPSLFELAPVIEVSLTHADESFSALARSPVMQKVRTLDLSSNYLSNAQVQVLLRSPYADRLRALSLSGIGNAGSRAVCASRALSNLKSLQMLHCGLTGSNWLLQRSPLQQLVELNLSSNDLGDSGVGLLARSSIGTSLRRLELSHCQLGPEGVLRLAASNRLAHLTQLDLSNNAVGDAGAAALANSAMLNGLEFLSLRSTEIGLAGARALAQSQMLEGLRYLDLSGNRLNSRQKNRLELRFGSRVKF